MIIDPLETIIQWLTNHLKSTSGRVAGKHRFGDTWAADETGISAQLDGGVFEVYGEIAMPRIELRIYGKDQEAMVEAYRELTGLCRDQKRFVVETSKGNALVYFVKPESSLSTLYDEDLRRDCGMVFLQSWISEMPVL
jgi:hypothetical protein